MQHTLHSSRPEDFTKNHSNSIIYELWRQDDNGGSFLMQTFDNEEEALATQHLYEARGHKQIYWITAVTLD